MQFFLAITRWINDKSSIGMKLAVGLHDACGKSVARVNSRKNLHEHYLRIDVKSFIFILCIET